MATTKSEAKRRKLGAEIVAGLGEVRRHLRGERTGVAVSRVPVPPALSDAIVHLRKHRRGRGLTMQSVSRKSGIARETLSRLEAGAIPNPTWKTMTDYAAALGCRLVLRVEQAAGKTRG